MLKAVRGRDGVQGHLPQGRCGLKCVHVDKPCKRFGHLPQGRCGLKSWGCLNWLMPETVTFRKEGVDWNGASTGRDAGWDWSPSARKVWIEIFKVHRQLRTITVTFRKEGVDWNKTGCNELIVDPVTFRKEGVDWNRIMIQLIGSLAVTFRKEGVDWNLKKAGFATYHLGHLPQGRCGLKWLCPDILQSPCDRSPSARKVWIEIERNGWKNWMSVVTFRKEGVDWNHLPLLQKLRNP